MRSESQAPSAGRVLLLGRPRVELAVGGQQPQRQPRGRKSWALLARVGLAERAVSRRDLAAVLFADADDPLAALRWSLAEVRASLSCSELLRGDPLSLPADMVWLDVRASADGSLPDAALGRILLDGIELGDCAEFTGWLLTARARCARRSQAELRERALQSLAEGDSARAVDLASRAARLDALDEPAQELFLQALVADGQARLAQAQLAVCEATFAREGVVASAALRAAAQDHPARTSGMRASVVAASLLAAGQAALDAGAVDAGVETLRRAAEDAARANEPNLETRVLRALGSALVHAVRGRDGEGALVLHRALRAARVADDPAATADILRELAFVDLQAGRHDSADRALAEANRLATASADPALLADIRAIEGMNAADRGRHHAASALLTEAAAQAAAAGRFRRQAWALGVLGRSLLLLGQVDEARRTAEASMAIVRTQQWNAFLPWPQAIHAECLATTGDADAACAEAEQSFALACELGDPCWEGMAARVLGMLAWRSGDHDQAETWLRAARQRSDRVTDRYVWVSGYVRLAQLNVAAQHHPARAVAAAAELYEFAMRTDLPEFQAWALIHRSGPGDAELARELACAVDNPALHARIEKLGCQ